MFLLLLRYCRAALSDMCEHVLALMFYVDIFVNVARHVHDDQTENSCVFARLSSSGKMQCFYTEFVIDVLCHETSGQSHFSYFVNCCSQH